MRIVELAGLGPAPFAGMVLADLGAEVVRVDRIDAVDKSDQVRAFEELRGKRSLAVDLKNPAGTEITLDLIDAADVLIEGYRPEVAERLGLGPEVCLQRNKRLVYARVTGWGRFGPYAALAGHDINYIAQSGLLGALGEPDRPPLPPLNVAGDYAGGGYGLALAIVAALHSARTTGEGQVVDVSMLETVALTMFRLHHQRTTGQWNDDRLNNTSDGGAPFYRTYETADGKYVAVGAIEPKFYARLLQALQIEDVDPQCQWDRSEWPALRGRFAERFCAADRDTWVSLNAKLDACISPVLSPAEAPAHEHNRAIELFTTREEAAEPRPVARFSRSNLGTSLAGARAGQHSIDVVRDWNLRDSATIDVLLAAGAIAQRSGATANEGGSCDH